MRLEQLHQNARRASRFLAALSNENRLLLLCQLVEGEKSVSELTRAIGLSQSAMSQHLARLRSEGLVRPRRDGQVVYYSLVGSDVLQVIEILYEIYCCPYREGATPLPEGDSDRPRGKADADPPASHGAPAE